MLDELENSLDNAAMCAEFLRLPSKLRWKWAILAMHGALYGFAICAIRGTASNSVLKDPNNHSSQLISIHTALKRTKEPRYLRPGATPLMTTPAEDAALELLIREFRNGFQHFGAIIWAIETSGMPTLFGHALRVLRHIALDSGSVPYENDDQRRRAEQALAAIEAALAVENAT